MALFSREKKDEAAKAVESNPKESAAKAAVAKPAGRDNGAGGKNTSVSKQLPTDRNLSAVIEKPRVTEKAVKMGESNVYTFVVRKNATKYDVRDAVKELFKVTPIKVNIVNKSPRQYTSRSKNRTVSEKGMKKAYVYLKAGDSIELA